MPITKIVQAGDIKLKVPTAQVGPAGVSTGTQFVFDAVNTSDADPGAGKMRLNHAAPASATAAYIHNADRFGNSVTAWLDAMDNRGESSFRGHIRMTMRGGEGAFAEFIVSGSVVDGTGYRKLTIAHQFGTLDPVDGAFVVVDFVSAGSNGISGTAGFDTAADLEGATVPGSVNFIDVGGYAVVGVGAARYTRSEAGQIQSADGAWWKISERIKRPEMYGVLDFDSADPDDRATTNTATFAALFADIQDGDRIVYDGPDVVDLNGGTLALTSKDRLTFDFRGASFQNRNDFSMLFALTTCDKLKWLGVDFYGFAHTEIEAEETPSEFDGGSSSANGAGLLRLSGCNGVKIKFVDTKDNAGQDIFGTDCDDVEVAYCTFDGIGADYISPVDSGVDVGIYFFQSSTVLALAEKLTSADMPKLRAHHNTFRNSSFGAVVSAYQLIFNDNQVGPHPGQHGLYGSELENSVIANNTVRDCYQLGIKYQLENHAGQYGAAAWVTATPYTAGQERTNGGTLYECLTNHTSGTFATDLGAGKWKISSKMQRRSVVIANNTIQRCGTGIGVIDAIGSSKEAYLEGLIVKGNTITDGVADGSGNGNGIYASRCVRSLIEGNTILRHGVFGIYAPDFGGSVRGNTIEKSIGDGLLLSLSFDAFVEDNKIIDCGLTDSDPNQRYPLLIAVASTNIPSHLAAPYLLFKGNSIRFSSGDAASTYVGVIGEGITADIVDTFTNSEKSLLCSGTAQTDDRNQCTVT